MIYYAIFCVTTAIMVLWRCQIPAWLAANNKSNINPFIFWPVLIVQDLVFAPAFFVVLLSSSKEYKRIIIEKLNEQS